MMNMAEISQLLVTVLILLGTIYLVSIGEMTTEQLFQAWAMLGLGMGVGYFNGKKVSK